jgi:hypothetical protein
MTTTRFYEGEYAYRCTGDCGSIFVTYAYENEEWVTTALMYGTIVPPCEACNAPMAWQGWSGSSRISEELAQIVDAKLWMAATVMIAAYMEYRLDSLLWATLVDAGVDHATANKLADGSNQRGDVIRIIRQLLGRPIKNIVFEVRNQVAHGRGFAVPNEAYHTSVLDQLTAIKKWVSSVEAGTVSDGWNPTEVERWVLSMRHWCIWFTNRVESAA